METAADQAPSLELASVSFWYRKGKPVFSDLSLSLSPGSVYGILGKNAAGKTSLLKLLAGLRRPKSGSVARGGQPIRPRRPEYLRELFFLDEDARPPKMKVRSYIDRVSAYYPRFDRGRMAQLLEDFEVPPDGRLGDLSQGEGRKFLLAFGFATGASLLLLDEPTNGLDIPSKAAFRRALARAMGPERIIAISTHQARDLEAVIDRVMILEGGEMAYEGCAGDGGAASEVAGEGAEGGGCDLESLFVRVLEERKAKMAAGASSRDAERKGGSV